jgi:hypothetical protein
MKRLLLIGLVVEIIVGGLILLVLLSPISQAQSGNYADNTTSALMEFLPDIRKIYRTALISPLQEVEQEIQDPDIAEFYHRLLQKYDLGEP